jgi:hypothetical protein
MLGLSLLALGLVALLVLAFVVPVSVASSFQGRAEPSGGWAVAFGLAVGPFALSAIAAAGVPPFVTCHVFGKQLARIPVSRWLGRSKPSDQAKGGPAESAPSGFERRVRRFVRELDPVDTVLSWWEKERVFEVTGLVVEVAYSFRDVALTGQTLAALYVLSGVLPERYVINQTPAWDSEDRIALSADGRFRIWPGRLFVDVASFVLKETAKARRNVRSASE